MVTEKLHFGKPDLASIPNYVFAGYNFGHSLIIFLIVFCVIYYITRSVPIVIGGWLLHILLDVPTHTTEFFPTPFLLPLNNFRFNGISWSDPIFMIMNYGLLFVIYVYLFIKVKRK